MYSQIFGLIIYFNSLKAKTWNLINRPKLYNLLYVTKLFRINVTAFEKFCSSKVGRSNKRVQKGYTRKAIPLLNKVYFNTYLELKKKKQFVSKWNNCFFNSFGKMVCNFMFDSFFQFSKQCFNQQKWIQHEITLILLLVFTQQ